ncbi:MAG TPA: carboxypeptidase regulatory-like domain-containing protein [Candidatus Saccharimonadales bacterium]|nr:carboxypeptidase regulatory-like domain-containing protein [Candidatus Saccharimonadales bacterium]
MVRWMVIAFSCLVVTANCLGQIDSPKEPQKQSIHGTVIEAKSGQPIRKVRVEVFGGAAQSFGPHSATTSADGTFSIEDIPPGRYTVNLQHTGFVQTMTSPGQRTFTLQPGQSITMLKFKMDAAGVISGKIVDSDGDPISAVSVNATLPGSMPLTGMLGSFGSATTNDLGEYRISDLRPGKYLISALPSQREPVVHVDEKGKTKEPLIYASTFYPGTIDKTRAIAVEVRGGQDAAVNFGVLLTHAYRVSGTVAGVPSQAMVRLILTSKLGGAGMDAPEELRQDNRFEYQNVLPGSYVVVMLVVKGIGSGGQPDMQMVRLAPSIEVDNSDVVGVQLQTEPVGQIHGKFHLDTDGTFDWAQLNVNLLPIAENESNTLSGIAEGAAYIRPTSNSVVNSDGSFEMKNVPSGKYYLVVGAHSDSLRDYYTKSVNFGGRNVADSGFETNGDLYLDVVVSAKGATIDGTVLDSHAQPVPYAVVVVVPNLEHRARPDSYQQETSDERGHFTARGLNAGSFVVLAFEELQEDMRQPGFLNKHRGKGEKVDVEEGTRKSVTARIIPVESEAP